MAIGLGYGKFGKPTETSQPSSPYTNVNAEAGPSKSKPSTRSSTPQSSKGKSPSTASTTTSKEPSTQTTQNPTKSSWWSSLPSIPIPTAAATPKTMYGIGAMALGAAAVGTVYYRREDFMSGWNWGYEHMTFVRNLWDEEGMKGRLEDLNGLVDLRGIVFRKCVIGSTLNF